MCLIEGYDRAHRRNLWFVFRKSECNNHLWIWYTMYICHLKGCDLHKNDDISNQQICLCDNLGDLFTKSLPSIIFEQLIQKIGLHFLTCFIDWGGDINISCTLFPFTMILSHLVFLVKFLTRQVYGILYLFSSLGFFPY